jgi:hypothetical protein
MTIYKTLLDTSLSADELVTRLDARLSKVELQNLSKVFGLSPGKKTKEKIAQEIVTHVQDALHPRLDRFRTLAPTSQYERTLSDIELYLYAKTKRPDEDVEVPLLFSQMPEIEEDQEDIEFYEDNEEKESLRPSKGIEETYSQFAVLYFIEQLEKGEPPRLPGFKSYMINEAAIVRPDRALLQTSYHSLQDQLKAYSTPQEKLRYLQSTLPSISRSASPERTKEALFPLDANATEEPEEIELIEEEIPEPKRSLPSLDQAILFFLRDQYENNSKILLHYVPPYVRKLGLTSYSTEIIRERYDYYMNQLKNIGKKRELRLEQVQAWLSEYENETNEVEDFDEDEGEGEVDIEDVDEDEVESEPQIEESSSPDIVELPPSELSLKVEAPEVCNVMESHATLEELAGDLTCSEGKVCNVDEQVCVLPTPETVNTILQIGDKMLPVTGKSDSEIVRDIKKEIVTLTTQLQRKERTNRDKLLELKKFISTPVDLDKLWSSLRSYQSSQQLYTQHKAQQANQDLRNKMKKSLFL